MFSEDGGLIGDSGLWQRKGGSAQSKVEGRSGMGGEQREDGSSLVAEKGHYQED